MEKSRRNKFFTLWIVLACVVVFVIQIIFPNFTSIFVLDENSLIQPWRFLTAIFLHGGVAHLLYNMFALLFFGLTLESMIGSKRFFWFYIISGVIANFISFWFYHSSLGASGAIMAVIGAVAVLRPMMTVWAFGIIMPMFVLGIIWVIGSFMGIFGFGDQGVGYIAHLSGIMMGILYGLYLRLKKKRREEDKVVFKRVIIPEEEMRRWENFYIR